MTRREFLLFPALAAAGCQSVPLGNLLTPQRVYALARLTTYVGTILDLRANPPHRPAFEMARDNLYSFIVSEKWDLPTALQILATLPIKEFSTLEGQLIIQGGFILIDLVEGGRFDAKEVAHLKSFLEGTHDGISTALRALPADKDLTLSYFQHEERRTRK